MGVQFKYLETSHWTEDGTCSYCGSISPDALFAAIAAGCELGPTDKDYKVYVDLVEPNPDELRVTSAITFDVSDERRQKEGWLPPDQELLTRDGWGGDYKWMQLSKRGPKKFGKFHFQHLSIDERKRFIDLLNAKAIKVGYPGHFYRLPFFAVKGASV